MSESASTFSFDETNAADQTMLTLTITTRTRLGAIFIDATNATRNITAKVFVDLGVGGATSIQLGSYDYVIAAGTAENILQASGIFESATDVIIKLACDGLGAGNVDIYYRVPYDNSLDNVESVFNGTGAADDVDISMKSLEIINDDGDAVVITCTDPGSVAVDITNSQGDVVKLESTGVDGDALVLTGFGLGAAANLTAGATGDVIKIVAADGHGVNIDIAGASKHGIMVDSHNADAVHLDGGIYGLYCLGADRSMHIQSSAAEAVYLDGVTAGLDINASGGQGIDINSSAEGITINPVNGDGIAIVAAGTGKNAIDLKADNDGKALEINQRTKSGDEDIMQLMYSRLAGKNTMNNTGGSSEIEIKLYNYAEGAAVKTITALKPDASDNTETLNVNALAGMEE